MLINDKELSVVHDLIVLTNKLKLVERTIKIPNADRNENSAEHSFQLAILAWYVARVVRPTAKLNLERVIKYALVHDLVEAYVGDICLFTDSEAIKEKYAQEWKALEQIKNEFKGFAELSLTIKWYMEQQDLEAKFVNFVDKLTPFINDLMMGMASSISKNVPLAKIRERSVDSQTFPGSQEVMLSLLSQAEECYRRAGREDLI